MLEQIGSEGGIPSPPDRLEPMEGVLKSNSHHETFIEEACYRLPQYFHKAYNLGFPAFLWNKYHRLQNTLILQNTVAKICLDQGDKIQPVCRV